MLEASLLPTISAAMAACFQNRAAARACSLAFHFINIAIAAPGTGLALFPHLTRERV